MEYVILGLLMIESMTLYSLNKAFERGISLFYSPSLGSIQSAVKRLQDRGLVSTEEVIVKGRNKKILTILPVGQTVFFEWLRSDLDMKQLEVSFLSRLYFIGLVQDKNQERRILQRMLSCVKASKEVLDVTGQQLDQLELPASYGHIFYYQRKVLDYGVDTHGYAIKWIEALIAEIESNAV